MLTYRKALQDVVSLSYPIVLGQLGITLIGLADSVMVAEVSVEALGAVGVANAIFFIICVTGIGTLSVVSSQISASQAQNKRQKCNLWLSNSLFVGFILGVLGGLLMAFLAYNFHWFGQTKNVTRLAQSYLYICAPSMLPLLLFIAVRNFTDGLSRPLLGMFMSFFGFFCNVFLNWLLIFGKWGFPALEVEGAAWATTITRFLMFFGLIFWTFLDKPLQTYLVDFSFLNIRKRFVIKNLRIGFPAGGQMFFEVGAFGGAGIIMGWISEEALGAHQIALSLSSVTYMISLGLSIAGGVLVGGAFGERNPQHIKRYGTITFGLVGSFMVMMALFFIIFPQFWVSFYLSEIKSPEVVPIAINLVILAGIYQIGDGIQCVGLGVLRGIEDTKIPTVVTFIAYWLIGIGGSYVLGIHLKWGAEGVWIGLVVALSFAAVMHTWRFYRRVGKLFL